jgi:hypothetical protein
MTLNQLGISKNRLFLCFSRSIFFFSIFRIFRNNLDICFPQFCKKFYLSVLFETLLYLPPKQSLDFRKKIKMDASCPQMNIHETLFYSFITKECPTFMADKLIMLFRVAMMVFRNGNVSYNAVMICNTLMVDFFCRNHRILARGLGLEFIDNVLFRLIRNEGFWHFLNAGNVHLFYLDYRTKMMNLICHQLAKMYGHEHFHNIFRNLSPGMRGRQDLGKVFL